MLPKRTCAKCKKKLPTTNKHEKEGITIPELWCTKCFKEVKKKPLLKFKLYNKSYKEMINNEINGKLAYDVFYYYDENKEILGIYPLP